MTFETFAVIATLHMFLFSWLGRSGQLNGKSTCCDFTNKHEKPEYEKYVWSCCGIPLVCHNREAPQFSDSPVSPCGREPQVSATNYRHFLHCTGASIVGLRMLLNMNCTRVTQLKSRTTEQATSEEGASACNRKTDEKTKRKQQKMKVMDE